MLRKTANKKALTKAQINTKNINILKALRVRAFNKASAYFYRKGNPIEYLPLKSKEYLPTKEEQTELVQFVSLMGVRPKPAVAKSSLEKYLKYKKKVVKEPTLTTSQKQYDSKKHWRTYQVSSGSKVKISKIMGMLRFNHLVQKTVLKMQPSQVKSHVVVKNHAAVKKQKVSNKDFFRFADGVYTSYWLGRLTNMFMTKGKKKLLIKSMHQAMLMLKYKYQTMPLLLLYELLERLKPIFLLRKYKIRRTQLVEYPYVAKNSRRYMKVLQWIRREIDYESRRGQVVEPFANKMYNKLTSIYNNPRKHSLIKTRDAHNTHSNMSQFNIRYNWKRSKRW